MEIQGKTCIFVGYPKDVKGYRLLDSGTHELIINMSVIFDEHSPQNIGSLYDSPSFELISPANDCAPEEQCNEVLPSLPNWGQIRTKSSLQRSSRVFMASASDPKDFNESHGIVEWDTAVEDGYNSLLKNCTRDLTLFQKVENLFGARGYIEPSMQQMVP